MKERKIKGGVYLLCIGSADDKMPPKMNDKDKTKEQLLSELAEFRRRISELEASETERKQVEEAISE